MVTVILRCNLKQLQTTHSHPAIKAEGNKSAHAHCDYSTSTGPCGKVLEGVPCWCHVKFVVGFNKNEENEEPIFLFLFYYILFEFLGRYNVALIPPLTKLKFIIIVIKKLKLVSFTPYNL
jgi:hypothetical protein